MATIVNHQSLDQNQSMNRIQSNLKNLHQNEARLEAVEALIKVPDKYIYLFSKHIYLSDKHIYSFRISIVILNINSIQIFMQLLRHNILVNHNILSNVASISFVKIN